MIDTRLKRFDGLHALGSEGARRTAGGARGARPRPARGRIHGLAVIRAAGQPARGAAFDAARRDHEGHRSRPPASRGPRGAVRRPWRQHEQPWRGHSRLKTNQASPRTRRTPSRGGESVAPRAPQARPGPRAGAAGVAVLSARARLMSREEAIVGEGCVDTPARQKAAEDLYRSASMICSNWRRGATSEQRRRTRIEGGPSSSRSKREKRRR